MRKIITTILFLICTFTYADNSFKISQEQAWEILKKNVLNNKYDNINAYVCTSVIHANSKIETMGDGEASPMTNSWLFFIDDIPYGNWSHPCRYVYVDCVSGEVTTHHHSMPPLKLDMQPLIEQETNSETLLYYNKKIKDLSPKSLITNSYLKNYASSKDYAIIINGGVNSTYNYKRYWNDCAAIYYALVNIYGYNKNHIYVLMSDGTNPAVDRHTNSGYDSSPLDLDGDGTNDIQYAATRTNVISVLNQLSNTLTTDNNLFIYTMDHGGSTNNNSYLCLWNNEKLFDYEFANLLSYINANVINICMGQCYSGGFIDNLTNSKFAIATACKYNEVSYCLNSSFGYDGYDAFVYYWTAAVNGAYPPYGTSVNADSNNDGYISMREAFDYAKSMDTANETPQFAYSPSGTDTRLNLYMEVPDTILGSEYISEEESYCIPNLPAGTSVTWSLSDSYYNQYCLDQNYPEQNQCTITCSGTYTMTNKALSATIRYNGYTVKSLTKTGLYAYDDIKGHYTSGNISSNISYTHILPVTPNCNTIIISPMLIGASASYSTSGTTPIYWGFSPTSGEIDVIMPSNNNSIPIVINIEDVFENQYTLYLFAQSSYGINVSNSENSITITFNDDNSERGINFDQPWAIEIRNATTGELMTSQSSTSRSTTISTFGRPKGIYIVKVTIGNEILTEKVVVK